MTSMKRMRNDHRREFTSLEIEVITKGEEGLIEQKRRVEKPNYTPFKVWARKQKIENPCPKLTQILASTPQ